MRDNRLDNITAVETAQTPTVQTNEHVDTIKALELKLMLYEELILHQTCILAQHDDEVQDHLSIIKFQAQYNEAQSRKLTERSHELRTYYGAIQGLSEVTRLITFNKIEHQFTELASNIDEFKTLNAVDPETIDAGKITLKRKEIEVLQTTIEASLIQASANLITIEQSSKAGIIYTSLILQESEINHDGKIQPETFDFDQCIENCIKMFREGKAVLQNISLKCKFDPIGKICSSQPHIKIIINNLVANAINYTPKNGHVTIIATLKIEQDLKSLILIIKDTGNGISKENIEKIRLNFKRNANSPNDNRFERLGDPDSTTGSGVGLMNVLRCVCLLNGEISVRSQGEGHGSTFVVTLPLS